MTKGPASRRRGPAAPVRKRSPRGLLLSLALGTLAILAGGAWWLLARIDRPPSAAEAVAVLPLPPHAGSPDLLLPPSLTPAETRLAAMGTEIEDADPLLARPGRSERPRARLELLVIDRSREMPVSGAEVLWCVAGDEQRLDRAITAVDELLLERGEAGESDRSGKLLVDAPRNGERLYATARAGALWGMLVLPPLERPSGRLELWPDGAVEVLVAHADGKPAAGVNVGLFQRRGGGLASEQSALADAAGQARFAHAGYTFARAEAEGPWYVGVAAALQEPVLSEVDPERLPRFPVQLRLPAGGRIEVEVLDLRGLPLSSGTCNLRLDERSPPGREARARGSSGLGAQVQAGRASFPYVGLGLDFQLSVRAAGEPGNAERPVAGPRSAGETVAVRVELGTDRPIVWFRALAGAEGPPLAGVLLNLQLVAGARGRGAGRGWSFTTDAEGRFPIEMGSTRAEPGRWLHVELDASSGGAPQVARADLAQAFPAGRTEGGDLVLSSLPPIASGRVIGDDGLPVADARVELHVPQPERPDRFQGTRVTDLTDAEGRFELRVPVDGDRLRVSASAPGRRSAFADCAPGAEGVELVLGRTGALRGRLWPPGLLPFEGLEVRLHSQQTRAARPTTPAKDGVFSYGEVDPGLYDLSIVLPRTNEELLRIGGLYVPPGDECGDPRLQRIDLTGLVLGIVLHLVVPDGGRGPTGRVEWSASGEAARQAVPIEGSRVRLLTRAQGIDLIVLADGYRSLALQGVRDDTRLELTPNLRVRLRVRGTPLPSEPYRVRVGLLARGVPSRGRPAFDRRGEAALDVDAPGEYRVQLQIEDGQGRGGRSRNLNLPQRLNVREVQGEQVFDLEIPHAELAATLEQLRR